MSINLVNNNEATEEALLKEDFVQKANKGEQFPLELKSLH